MLVYVLSFHGHVIGVYKTIDGAKEYAVSGYYIHPLSEWIVSNDGLLHSVFDLMGDTIIEVIPLEE